MLHKIIEPSFDIRQASCRPPMALCWEIQNGDSCEVFVVLGLAEVHFASFTPRLIIRNIQDIPV